MQGDSPIPLPYGMIINSIPSRDRRHILNTDMHNKQMVKSRPAGLGTPRKMHRFIVG